jgi:Endodeoxyribonuclease RusA
MLQPDEYRIWVPGLPKSQQASKKHLAPYVAAIQDAARAQFSAPLAALGIEIIVVFADSRKRPDVDDVQKLVLDALKGIVYADDRQVVSGRAEVLPRDDRLRMVGGAPHRTFAQLLDTDQFLIRILVPVFPSIANELPSS